MNDNLCRACGLVALTLMVITCSSCARSSDTTGTGLEGTISISPIRPGPTREDQPDAAPLQSVTFAVVNENGVIAHFTTDDSGKFKVSLKPGHYTVSIEADTRIRHCGPFEVEIATSGVTTVQWRCDSGMR